MSNGQDGPPPGRFPEEGRDGGHGQRQGGQRNNRAAGSSQRRERTFDFNVEAEKAAFFAYITDRANKLEYGKLLGPDIDVDRFVSIAIDAVNQKPELLEPALRSSLFFSLKKAARQGLKPDGREGALIPRYNKDAGGRVVEWQSMVWGIRKAGHRAGAIKKLTAELVFSGEPFRFVRGDEERIEHEWVPEVRSKAYQHLRPAPNDGYGDSPGIDFMGFWEEVVAAYCIIEAPDGTKTRRAMPTERLMNLRDYAKATGGPWFSVWVDEMMLKAVILFAAKHIELDATDEKVKAFRAALEDGMDVNFDEDGRVQTIDHEPAPPAASSRQALSAPDNAMSRLTETVMGKGRQREAVTAGGNSEGGRETHQQQSQKEPDRQSTRQQKPVDQDRAETKPVTQTERTSADQGSRQATVSDDEKLARGFSERLIGEIRMAIGRGDGEDYLSSLIGQSRNSSGLGRLQNSYRDLHDNVVRAFLEPGVIEKIGGLQSSHPHLYDVIVAKMNARTENQIAA